MLKLIGCILCYFVLDVQAYTATFIKPCKVNDNACLIASAQEAIPHMVNGIPELKIPTFNPLFVKRGKYDSDSLKIKYSDVNVYGLKDIKIHNVVRDTIAKTIKIEGEMPLRAVGQYDMKGKIPPIALQGNGGFEIKTDKVKFNTTLKIKDDVGADGKKHWKLSSFDYTYDIIDKVHYNMENLLGGDENSGKLVKEFFDTNGKEIAEDVGGPIVKEIFTDAMSHVKKVIECLPDNIELV